MSEYDEQAIQYTMRYIAEPAAQRIEAVRADGRLSDSAKQEDAQAIASVALEEIAADVQQNLQGWEAELAQHTETLASMPTPTPDQIQVLSYTRDALALQWQQMTTDEMRRAWQRAIELGDSATARVYADFSLPHFERKLGVPGTPAYFDELKLKTWGMVSPAHAEAAEKIPYLQRSIVLAKIAGETARDRVLSAVNPANSAMRRAMRNVFQESGF